MKNFWSAAFEYGTGIFRDSGSRTNDGPARAGVGNAVGVAMAAQMAAALQHH